MSQNDFTIANQGFPAFRADLNLALQALASNNSGDTEPTTMFANMWWYDSANNIMYIRNEDNDAWIKFAELDQANDKFVLSGTLQLDDGTVSAPALTFNSDTNMGIYRGGTDILKFVTAGTDAVTIDASQQVGIGETTPDTPLHITYARDVAYSIDNFTIEANVALKIENTSSTGSAMSIIQFRTGGGADMFFGTEQKTGNDGDFIFGNQNTANIEMMRIKSTGNVGIGINIPSQKLHVNGNIQLENGTEIRFKDTGGTERTAVYMSSNDLNIGTSAGGNLKFYNGSSYTERMRIDTNGHVTMPYQSAFLVAKNSADQNNIPIDSHQTIVFDSEKFDQNSDVASNTFTTPVTGRYQLNVNVRIKTLDSAAAYYHVRIVTSNRVYGSIFDPDFGQDQAHWSINMSVLVDMDASDTAYVTIFQSGGTAQMDVLADEGATNFSGYLVA